MSLVWSKHLECGPYFSNAKFLSGSERRVHLERESNYYDARARFFVLSAIRGADVASICATRLTRIILFVKAVGSSDYYISRSPREFLYVRAVIRQRHRSAVVLFVSDWHVRNRVEVLQYERVDRQAGIFTHVANILTLSMRHVGRDNGNMSRERIRR